MHKISAKEYIHIQLQRQKHIKQTSEKNYHLLS